MPARLALRLAQDIGQVAKVRGRREEQCAEARFGRRSDKHFPYRISMPAILIWTAVVILGAVLATEAAGSRASRITVGEALAYL